MDCGVPHFLGVGVINGAMPLLLSESALERMGVDILRTGKCLLIRGVDVQPRREGDANQVTVDLLDFGDNEWGAFVVETISTNACATDGSTGGSDVEVIRGAERPTDDDSGSLAYWSNKASRILRGVVLEFFVYKNRFQQVYDSPGTF